MSFRRSYGMSTMGVRAFAARMDAIESNPAALLVWNIYYNNALGEGNTLNQHVIDYLIGQPWNTDVKGRKLMEEWHNTLTCR